MRRSNRLKSREVHAENLIAAISVKLLRYVANLESLADGYQGAPPDLRANIYLIDRVLGRVGDAQTAPQAQVSGVFDGVAKILNRHGPRESKQTTDHTARKGRPRKPGRAVRGTRG